MRELHLFAGAGGGILGGILFGHTCVCAVEIEPYRRRVLLQRQRDGILPWFPIWDDVRTFDGRPWWGRAEIVCAGIPCQKVSPAGNGDESGFLRTDYYAAFKRIIREVGPIGILLENSSALLFRGLHTVLSDLAELGFDARWGVLGADDAGLDHKRKRTWVFAYPAETRRARVLRRNSGISPSAYNGRSSTPLDTRCATLRRLEQRVGESAILRSSDGLACGMDRLEAVGDGQVPSVAALAWRTLSGETVVKRNANHAQPLLTKKAITPTA